MDQNEVGKSLSSDPMVLFFTSGTTGNPKMVRHEMSYPLAHYATAFFAHDLKPTDIHWTLSDTGWAKHAWGKIFGQWIVGATVFQYRQDRFQAELVLKILDKYCVTTFCAPPYTFILSFF